MQTFSLKLSPPPHILAEQLRVSHRPLPAAVRVNIVLALGISWIFYSVVPMGLLFTWLACVIGISLLRIFSLAHIADDDFTGKEAYQYALRYALTAFLLGSCWASLAFLLPYIGTEERILIFVLLVAMAGAALTTTAGHVISFYSYSYPILIAYAANAFMLEGRTWILLGVLTMVYGLYMSLAAWKLNSSLQESIILRFNWQETADDLVQTKEELNKELNTRIVTEKKLNSVMVELRFAVMSLEQLAAIDELTGIPNRRSFDAAIAREWSRARREQSSIALLMIDVDHFKRYNDLYHHQQGDEALKQVARTISLFAQRPGDIAARYGGEEFCLILANPTQDSINETAEKLRKEVSALKIKHEDSDISDYITVSIGTAMSTAPGNDDYSQLINAADTALYEAKQAGRNKVMAA